VKGQSRRDAGIFHGDIAILNRQEQVSDGQIATVIIDNEAALKRFYRNGDSILLRAANADFEDIVVRSSDDRQVTIAGRLVGVRRTHGGFRK
jgi:repressor LexA